MDVMKSFDLWTNNLYFDESTRNELLALSGDNDAIRERFYRELDFGTAGIRAEIGAGTNRINKYVVRRVSYGIAKMIMSRGEEAMKRGVVIGYDSRNFSYEFACEAASVYAGHGINVYLHTDITPVPVLSYSIRELKTEIGIMVTASHNPKEYNGYKVYGSDGAQIPPEDSAFVVSVINKISDYTKLPAFNFDFFKKRKLIKDVPGRVYNKYLDAVKALVVNKNIIEEGASSLKLVYTPIHGAGAKWVPKLLGQLGFNQLSVVEEQMKPDGNFSTVKVPNPENRDVYTLGVKLAEEIGANLILATDPDADRTGAFVKSSDGEYIMLNGNQIGALLLEYILSTKKANNDPSLENGFVVSTIVSSTLAKAICDNYGVSFKQVLTGFKFIGEQIVLREENGNEKFIFGFEESYGYLAGSYCRDKDAVASCMLLSEAACYYNTKGMTLLDAIDEIYKKYGYYTDMQVSLELKGEQGVQMMADLMQKLRDLKGSVIDREFLEFKDIKTGEAYNCKTGETSKIDLPSSNVLHYILEDGWFAVRPSGTEPKIKIYFGFRNEDSMEKAKELADSVKAELMEVIKNIIDNL